MKKFRTTAWLYFWSHEYRYKLFREGKFSATLMSVTYLYDYFKIILPNIRIKIVHIINNYIY
jgi:hypothetical protein